MKAIILDGFHEGTILNVPELPPEIRIPVPKRIISCDCYDDSNGWDYGPEIKTYLVCGKPIDYTEGCALYSVSGNLFDALTKLRTWIAEAPHFKNKPLYLHCMDTRAQQ